MAEESLRLIRLEVERPADPGELVNLVQNPDGRLGAWAWVTPVDGSVLRGGPDGLTYTSPGGVSSWFATEPMPVTSGAWVAATWRAEAGDGSYRASVDWLDADGVVIGSTTPSAYYTFGATQRVEGAHQAPTGTAYARLRFNHYATTTGGNPAAGKKMRVTGVTFTAAGSSGTLQSVRTNLFPNPSGETGTAGWWIRDGGNLGTRTGGVAGGQCVVATKTSTGAGLTVDTSYAAITPGRDYAFQIRSRPYTTARKLRLFAVWYNSAGKEVAATLIRTATQTAGAWTPPLGATATAPSNAVGARLRTKVVGAVKNERHWFDASMAEPGRRVTPYFDGDTPDTTGEGAVDYAWLGTPHASPSTATKGEIPELQPIQWLNILGPTHEITVNREALNIGALSATVLDAELDPAQADTIRPGRRLRLMTVDDDVIYTGWVAPQLSVEYRLLADDSKRAKISLNAVDAVNKLASSPRPEGVATIAELPYVLEGAGVPWSVNGSGDQVPTAAVAAYNDNASAADQLAVTRDTVQGYAWVDRNGVVQAWDRNLMPSTPVVTLDETVYRSDFEVGYDTESIINSVGVTVLKVIPTSGITEEVTFPPVRDENSIREWGLYHQDFTVAIDATEAAVAAWAGGILSVNAQPRVLVRRCVVPIRTAEHLPRALLDLYDPVTVVNGTAGINEIQRVAQLEHTITATPTGGKWLMSVGFTGEGVAAPSTTVPSPPPRVGDAVNEVRGGYTGTLQDVYAAADAAAQAAQDAAATADAAQLSANGKSKVHYSTLDPGTTPNMAGDVWFQKDAATQTIIGQWEGLSGTDWEPKTLASQVIANLDAGKLTAGSAFVNGLSVLTSFILGNATTDGVIQTYDFANASTGAMLSKAGLVAKGGDIAGATITGGLFRTSFGSARVEIDQESAATGAVKFFTGNETGTPHRINASNRYFQVIGGVYGTATRKPIITLYSGLDDPNNWISVNPGGGNIYLQAPETNIDGQIRIQAGSTSAAANAYIASSGLLMKSTSSRRYKKYLRDLDRDHDVDKLLSLRPVTFQPKAGTTEAGRRYAGFIAEEAHDLGLTEFVDYDDEGQPDGFYYANFTAALQTVARHQAKKITTLESRVAALEGQVTQLLATITPAATTAAATTKGV